MKAREYPDKRSHYVNSRVWSVLFHPVQSSKAGRFAQLIPKFGSNTATIHVRNQTKGTIMTSKNSPNLVHLKLYALNMLRRHPSLSAVRISTSIPNDLLQELTEPRTAVGWAPTTARPSTKRSTPSHVVWGDHWVMNAVIFA